MRFVHIDDWTIWKDTWKNYRNRLKIVPSAGRHPLIYLAMSCGFFRRSLPQLLLQYLSMTVVDLCEACLVFVWMIRRAITPPDELQSTVQSLSGRRYPKNVPCWYCMKPLWWIGNYWKQQLLHWQILNFRLYRIPTARRPFRISPFRTYDVKAATISSISSPYSRSIQLSIKARVPMFQFREFSIFTQNTQD